MKHQRRVALPCLLVAILCQHQARSLQGTAGSRWVPSSSRIVPQGTPVTARSQLQCAALCMRTVRCYRFCHNTVTLTCFLDTCMPSDTGQVVADATKCYDKVMKQCPAIDGYHLHCSHCIKLNTTSATYSSATTQCGLEGGHLYFFKTLAVDKPPLTSLIPQNLVSYYIWIGADAVGRKRQFAWSDGTPLPVTSEVWQVGEPNNVLEDCLSVIVLDISQHKGKTP
ncbi:hypothetical protein C0Q70_14581 [Pomacea canaliculata]|uniref:C-type lectin domain-containing protein n=1 Tax=Pomacea canaliculata TaxID=400727 RepID=A0A2T7NSG2_POMCA|nr:hypothetical protein C0Q70_14581 [Pomacea canaliculata]